jgi:hypothetical protein
MMPITKSSIGNMIFATSIYGDQWAGSDGDRLTIALQLLQSETASTIQIDSFVDSLEYTPSTPVSSIIESTTDWRVDPNGQYRLIASNSSFIVALTEDGNSPQWPDSYRTKNCSR